MHEERYSMNTIITIGRQYGSGGREIGQKIADHYGIKFYDRELLARHKNLMKEKTENQN